MIPAISASTTGGHTSRTPSVALTGHPGLLRIRVGDYCVVYSVDDGKLVVTVIAAAHRRTIYRDQ